MIRFERLTTGESSRLRSIRLRALQDAPDAFETTFEEAAAKSADAWRKQLLELPTFVGVENGHDVGMVRCARDKHVTDMAWLISMWVEPKARRAGIGSKLVDVVIEWARANGISRLVLDVADLNVPAVALYRAKGFVPNGKSGALPPPRDHIREHQLELRLDCTDG
jgi:GNAT superfamily N-acetyltransferase